MSRSIPIRTLLRKGKPLLSFEFFPPKNEESGHVLDETAEKLRRFLPDFVSITYGAGGSSQDRTLSWTLRLRDLHGYNPMMHFTCITASREQVRETVAVLKERGVRNILALRGDPPADLPPGAIRRDFAYAADLVAFLRGEDDFSIGVAGYPEGHPESPSPEADLDYLKRKVDAGADFVITQLFFENAHFLRFRDRAAAAGIRVPLVAGIMPVASLQQLAKSTELSRASVPAGLLRRIEGKDGETVLREGVAHAVGQCRELLEEGVAGLHFYTFNRNRATELVLEGIAPHF
jgi:methylenetetrahydrofolate reductase (NADPH)